MNSRQFISDLMQAYDDANYKVRPIKSTDTIKSTNPNRPNPFHQAVYKIK